jgi:quercetin dioxygenase-like cupin family protein
MLSSKMKWLTSFLSLLYCGGLSAQSQPAGNVSRKALLQQALPATTVETVRMDEITFAPGQGAPEHYHPCEVYGYVVTGQIVYQVYGQPPVILNPGDGFREVAGQRILAFKNALADKPGKFIAIYLLAKKDQPVIVLTGDQKIK